MRCLKGWNWLSNQGTMYTQRLTEHKVGPPWCSTCFINFFTQIGAAYSISCKSTHWNHQLIRTVIPNQDQVSSQIKRILPFFSSFLQHRIYSSIPSQSPRCEIIIESVLFTPLYHSYFRKVQRGSSMQALREQQVPVNQASCYSPCKSMLANLATVLLCEVQFQPQLQAFNVNVFIFLVSLVALCAFYQGWLKKNKTR